MHPVHRPFVRYSERSCRVANALLVAEGVHMARSLRRVRSRSADGHRRSVSSTVLMLSALTLGSAACDETKETQQESQAAAHAPDPSTEAPENTARTEVAPTKAKGQPLNAETIARIMGAEAKRAGEEVVKVTWPRDEVSVNIDGVDFPAAAGLTSWAGFSPASQNAMVMGDTVVFQDEVSPAMDAAFAHGLEISALHNHFFFDEPKVYFMHIGGHGPVEKLAQGVRAVWDAVREVRRERPKPASSFGGQSPSTGGTIDAKALSDIMGEEVVSKAPGVVKVTLPRRASMHGTSFGGAMGLTTWAAFTGSDDLAAIDGDFAMTAEEVQPVLRTLRKAGIHVVALHNHMVGEKPAYYFTHFWGKGAASELAKGFRSALDAQKSAAKQHLP